MSYFLKKYTTEIWIDMLFPNYMRKKKDIIEIKNFPYMIIKKNFKSGLCVYVSCTLQ